VLHARARDPSDAARRRSEPADEHRSESGQSARVLVAAPVVAMVAMVAAAGPVVAAGPVAVGVALPQSPL
jgi:hypothetical protein